jgi:hypothetical protein
VGESRLHHNSKNGSILLGETAMKTCRKELFFEVPARRAFINITPQVEKCLRESGIKEGLVLCNTTHI